MVMFPNGGMSDGNGSMRPIEDGYAPKFKVRKVSATRQFPPMCGLEYQHFRVQPEETAAVSGGENVALNLDFNAGAVTGSGLQNPPDGGGTSTEETASGSGGENVVLMVEPEEPAAVSGGENVALMVEPEETAAVSGGENVSLNLDFNAGAVTGSGRLRNQRDGGGTSTGLEIPEMAGFLFCDTVENSHEANGVQILPLEAWENDLTIQADASENLVYSGGWDNMFNGDTVASAIDLDTIDFEMEFGVEAQSHEIVGSPVEEEGNESVDMIVERAMKGFVLDMDERPNKMVEVKGVETESVQEDKGNTIEVQPSVEKLVYGEDEALAKRTDEDGGEKTPSEGGFVIHKEASTLSSKKRFHRRRVPAKRGYPKYCGLDAIVPPAEEDQDVSIESIDTTSGDTVAAAIDLDTIDFEMEFGVEAQSHEIVGSPVEEEGNESVMMVERAMKGFVFDMDEGPIKMVEVKGVETESVQEDKGNNIEVQPSVEKLVYGEDESLAKRTDEDGGKKNPSEGGFVIHGEASALSSKKRFRRRRVPAKRGFPKYCGLDAIVPPAGEDEDVSIESIDTRSGEVHAFPVRENGPDSGGLMAGSSASTVKPGWRGKTVAKKSVSNVNAQRLLHIKLSKSPTKQPAYSPHDKVRKNSEDEAPRKEGKRPSSSNKDARSKVLDVLCTYRTVCRELLQGEGSSRFEQGSKAMEKIRRIDCEAAKRLKSRGKEVNTETHHFVGAVPGVEVGDVFQYRVELAVVGIHRAYQGGIDCGTLGGQKIAVSIVASGGYDDDLGDPNVLIYSGQGGIPGRGKQAEDQKLERGNLGLWNSKTLKNPVRVVRGTKENDQDRSTKYVYDGLYTVEERWKIRGDHGKLVFMFKLTRNQGQPEVAWKSNVRHGVSLHNIARKPQPF